MGRKWTNSTGPGANFFPLTQTNLKDFGPLDLVQWFGSTPPVTGPFKAPPFMEGVGITTATRNSSGGRLIYTHHNGERTTYPKKTWLDPPNQPTPHPWFLWNLPVLPTPRCRDSAVASVVSPPHGPCRPRTVPSHHHDLEPSRGAVDLPPLRW